MKSFSVCLLLLILSTAYFKAYAQVGAVPVKQTIPLSFPASDVSILVPSNDICPSIPLEFKGTWPPGVDKITVRLLVSSSVDATTSADNRLLSFTYGGKRTLSAKKIKAPSIDTKAYYAFAEVVREEGVKDFTLTIAAPQLRRYYGIEVLCEGPVLPAVAAVAAKAAIPAKPEILAQPATSTTPAVAAVAAVPPVPAVTGVIGVPAGTRTLIRSTQGLGNDQQIPILYSGDLSLLPSERFIPYSGIGVGFLKIGDADGVYNLTPFLTTSIGLIITARPVYTGQRNPYIHRYKGLRGSASWVTNRLFFSGGITTASLSHRGRTLATSAVKGSLGTGIFLLPGLGLSYEFSFGGVANYNPTFDNRTNPFYMSGIMLRFTGDVTQIFKSAVGNALAQPESK